MGYHNKMEFSVFVILALATASMMWIGTETPKQQQVVAQSPMDMMNMTMGGSNMTDGTMMMGNGNMSMPFNMGVVIMPTMCATPNQLLGSLTGMFGDSGGNEGDATQQMMMEMMGQQMMSGGGKGMQNMSESKLQRAMNFQICFPMMGEEMMQHMMGSGRNSTGGMMNGMMMQ